MSFGSQQEWRHALETTANDILAVADDARQPPVDAFQIARRLNLTVVVDHAQPSRGRQKTMHGRPAIFLRGDDRPERLQWALAHEIGEINAWRVVEQLPEVSEPSPRLREDIANLLASSILLPGRWFFADAARRDYHLYELKSRYATASHALIALRFLDAPRPGVITIVDKGRVRCRRSNVAGFPRQLMPDEQVAVEEAQRIGTPAFRERGGCSIRAWPVHEPGWKREIVHAMVDESSTGDLNLANV